MAENEMQKRLKGINLKDMDDAPMEPSEEEFASMEDEEGMEPQKSAQELLDEFGPDVIREAYMLAEESNADSESEEDGEEEGDEFEEGEASVPVTGVASSYIPHGSGSLS